MLTADLLRVRDDKKTISPRYLKINGKAGPRFQKRAAAMIEAFETHIGQRRAVVDDVINDIIGDGTDFNLSRGLKKLLEDRSEFETTGAADPQRVRAIVFGLSAENHPIVAATDTLHTHTRDDILDEAARRLQAELEEAQGQPLTSALTREDIEEALYGDLKEQQRLTSFKPLAPDALLHRYNLALAQAVLYRARELRVRLKNDHPGRYRQLFRTLKFYQLMHRVARQSDGTWTLTIDGPLSLLKSTSKYGVQMAMFLPALLLCDGWSLEADLAWGPSRQRRTFLLDDSCELVSHYKAQGVYITEEQRHFERSFEALGSPWALSRDTELIDLGGRDVLVPDLVFKHRDDGRTALMEIVGFWRRGWLKSKAELLASHGPENLILVVSDRLQTDKGKDWQDLPVALLPFKGVILPKKALALIENHAV